MCGVSVWNPSGIGFTAFFFVMVSSLLSTVAVSTRGRPRPRRIDRTRRTRCGFSRLRLRPRAVAGVGAHVAAVFEPPALAGRRLTEPALERPIAVGHPDGLDDPH